jgi:hypothetical protein
MSTSEKVHSAQPYSNLNHLKNGQLPQLLEMAAPSTVPFPVFSAAASSTSLFNSESSLLIYLH